MKYKQAHSLAIQLRKQLEPFCFKIDFAGDIAKELPTVNNIIFFCIPKRTSSGDFHPMFIDFLFSQGAILTEHVNKLSTHIEIMNFDADIIHIFIPHEKQYYYELVKHDAGRLFMLQIDMAMEGKKDLDQSKLATEYNFFEAIGAKWVPVKNRN